MVGSGAIGNAALGVVTHKDPREAKSARKDGMGKIRAYYGGKFIPQLESELVVPERRMQALISVRYLIRYCPEGVMRVTGGALTGTTVGKG